MITDVTDTTDFTDVTGVADVTFLQNLQVLPEDVTDERWRPLEERLAALSDQLLAVHRELVQVDAFETELVDRPVEPLRHVQTAPAAGV